MSLFQSPQSLHTCGIGMRRVSPHSLNMQEKNCMAILIRGGEVVEREDVRPRRMSRCIYVVYKCVHIEVGMQIELSQTQQPQ